MAKAIEGEAYARGYRMTLCYSENKPEKEKESIRMLSRMNADGIILMTNNEEIDAEVKDCGIPVVAVDRVLMQMENWLLWKLTIMKVESWQPDI